MPTHGHFKTIIFHALSSASKNQIYYLRGP